MRISESIVRREIATLVAACPELQDDEQLRADMIEGETSAQEFLRRCLRACIMAEAMAAGCEESVSVLNARASRLYLQAGRLRDSMRRIMIEARLPVTHLPEGTLSIGKGRDRVVIDDVHDLPADLINLQIVPDKVRIMHRLNSGDVLGAHKETGEPTLIIRMK